MVICGEDYKELMAHKHSIPLHPSVNNARKDFNKGVLTEETMAQDPLDQFRSWMNDACEEEGELANAMVLSTVDKYHTPHARVVLLRDISCGGFTFFTNYNSNKAKELKQNPKASLLFFWKELGRQVRIEGMITEIPPEESDAYFASRPFESKASAWASEQSRPIENRSLLEEALTKKLKEFAGKQIPRPLHWGGYVVIPHYFEFWQGRENRLHDRITYTTMETNTDTWRLERLMP